MNETLKNLMYVLPDSNDLHDSLKTTPVFRKKDVKSAVEWLKKEIQSLPNDLSGKQFKIQMWHIIPKAFEDVISKPK